MGVVRFAARILMCWLGGEIMTYFLVPLGIDHEAFLG